MSPGRPDELVENDCVHRGEKASPQGENDHVPRGEKSSPQGENDRVPRGEKSSPLGENDSVPRGEKPSPQGENDHVPRGEKSSPLGENNCLSRREKSSLPTDVKSGKSVKYLLEFIFLSQSLMYSRKAYDSELLNRNSGQKVKRVFCLHMLIG